MAFAQKNHHWALYLLEFIPGFERNPSSICAGNITQEKKGVNLGKKGKSWDEMIYKGGENGGE
jgi:hypothetical protein